MKSLKFIALLLSGSLALSSCSYGANESVSQEHCSLLLPALPESYLTCLGQPCWEITWVDADGFIQTASTSASSLDVSLMEMWPAAALAYPFWPEKEIRAGIVKPAGAIFPFDADSHANTLSLSWEGGVDAFFYFELAKGGLEKRAPYLFDWKRFRGLFTDLRVPEDVVQNPWLVDWEEQARKTLASGFDWRRIKARNLGTVTITPPCEGPWLGESVFVSPQYWNADEEITVTWTSEIETWFSPKGVLRFSGKSVFWRAWFPDASTQETPD